jgi:tetrameric-type glycyl-tRNA synthetase beta subunit
MDRELLLEIGVEEMPASWLPSLNTQLASRLDARLAEQGLSMPRASVEAHSTPRRLAACLPELVDRQEDKDETVMGPPVSAAFDAEGHPTNAGLGFARKLGADFDALQQIDTPRGKYLAYQRRTRGRATVDVLPDVLAKVLRDLTFPKQMHWDAQLEDDKGEFLFGRPIRWLLFLYGGRVVPFTISRLAVASSLRVQDITSGAVTYGHRFLATSGRAGRAIKVRTFDEYRKKLAENFVILSRLERRDRILRELEAQARRIGGRALLQQHPQAEALLEEVPDLVEYPAVVSGAFSAEFLTLPEEVLRTTLIHHQHFFPVIGTNGSLMPAFLAVTNTQTTNDRLIATNCERVVTARLRDARFFWDADRKVGLEARLDRLDTVSFHRQLGSYRAKAERIERLASWIATDVLEQPAQADAAARAARLAKADLATEMVREFTELQGTMGGIYAREAREPEPVWKAIYYHYLPTAVEATAPPAPDHLGQARVTWAAVSLVDKLDTLVGLFLAGSVRPSSSGAWHPAHPARRRDARRPSHSHAALESPAQGGRRLPRPAWRRGRVEGPRRVPAGTAAGRPGEPRRRPPERPRRARRAERRRRRAGRRVARQRPRAAGVHRLRAVPAAGHRLQARAQHRPRAGRQRARRRSSAGAQRARGAGAPRRARAAAAGHRAGDPRRSRFQAGLRRGVQVRAGRGAVLQRGVRDDRRRAAPDGAAAVDEEAGAVDFTARRYF